MRRLVPVAPLVSILLAAALAGACTTTSDGANAGGASAASADPPRVGGTEARKLVEAGAVLLDVRTEEEFADGHIEGARNIPVGRLRGELGALPRDKVIVVYCAVGSRSAAAAQILKRAGYDARNLGAMANWRS